MTPKEKRILRQKIQVAVSQLIVDLSNNDKEYFLALLYANQQIANDLARFDDTFEED